MADTDVGYRLFVGIDIAADTFTAAWRASGGEGFPPYTGEQTPTGRAGLQQRLRATGLAPDATLVMLEATGPSWVALALGLHQAGYRVAVVNPRQAHHFAKAQLRRAKTDALDARDLAQLAATLQPTPWTPPPAVYHDVRQRLVARDALLAMRTQARNQRHALLQGRSWSKGCAASSTRCSPTWSSGSRVSTRRSPPCSRRVPGRRRWPA